MIMALKREEEEEKNHINDILCARCNAMKTCQNHIEESDYVSMWITALNDTITKSFI